MIADRWPIVALWHAGASRPLAALFGEAIPMLVAGLDLAASSAITARLVSNRLLLLGPSAVGAVPE